MSTALVVTALSVAAPANAAFPGQNGRIAFSTDFSRRPQVYTIRPDGTGLRQLTRVTSGHAASGPDWSPDGTRIVFTIDNQIWVMNADGSAQEQLTDQSGFENISPSWSPNGQGIVFSHCAVPFGFWAYCDIDAMNADGTGARRLVGGNWINMQPEYSPDGKHIAFNGSRGGYHSAMWVSNANGGGLKRLTDPSLEAWGADWSPDGSHITFTDNADLPHNDVWVMRSDGSDLREITQFPQDHSGVFARYSPDGKKIVLSSDLACPEDCGTDLYVMNADGSNLHAIVQGVPGIFATDWGPSVTP